MNLKSIYVVIVLLVGWGIANLFNNPSPTSKIVTEILCLVMLGVQAISATYWSGRWRKIADDWQSAARYTYEKLTAIIVKQDSELQRLQEPWRN